MGSSGSLNHIFRTVWNQALDAMVAVAEISTGRGKSATVPGHSKVDTCAGWPAHRLQNALLSLAIAFAWGAIPALTFANPTGGVAIQGQATFTTNGSNLLVTTQNGAGLNHSAINWQNFSIPTGSTTYFQQPNASSTSINRVVTNTPSLIFGTLGSNGNLVLVNQSGITVGAGAVVDTAGFTASALRMSDADALSGRMRFGDASSTAGAMSVMGSVLARSGDVVLMGSSVDTGTGALVQAPNGNTVLAAGQQIEITGRGLEGIVMQVQAPTDSAVNLGTLKGDAVGIFAGTLKHSGLIQATTATLEGGKVVLRAARLAEVASTVSANGTNGGSIDIAVAHSVNTSAPGALVQTGTLDASGADGLGGSIHLSADNLISAAAIRADGATTGGRIAVQMANRALSTASVEYSVNGSLGQGGDILVSAQASNYTSGSYSATGLVGGNVTLAGNEIKLAGTHVDVSGTNAGGNIHVGGLIHGALGFAAGGSALSNATTVLANGASTFKADALQSGNGGEVVLWSDKTLRFSGSISAKGGVISGDGGQAEVSGRTSLGYNGVTNLSAPHGAAGTLLLDPKNITVVAGGVSLYQEILDPTPGAGEGFGVEIAVTGGGQKVVLSPVALPNGHILVASPFDSLLGAKAGAVYHFDGTGSLISSLTGSQALDQVGSSGFRLLNNGNYVIVSPLWNNDTVSRAGAVTWGNGVTGVSGLVSAGNSLVGSTADESIGGGGVTLLPSGNYLVLASNWTDGAAISAGAVTWGSGTAGVSGVISSANSLVGSTAYDRIGTYGVTLLTNGNYVVNSPFWSNGPATLAGAITWGSGTSGVKGVVSDLNSLVGTTANDQLGSYYVTALSNGNYVVGSPHWHNGGVADAGALTWGSGTTGVKGVLSSSNSLVGSTTGDLVGGFYSLTQLDNGNYLVSTSGWSNGAQAGAGALTWGSGTSGVSGVISLANSLVGSATGDGIGNLYGIFKLSNGNYLLKSPNWKNVATGATNAGAVTWGSGTVGISGTVSAANSLVGTSNGDSVGNGIGQLTNGNYVVISPQWNNGTSTLAGAVTWGSGTTGVSGAVSNLNSLVGSSANDKVGSSSIVPLTNGNYLVNSPYWNNGAATLAGAVTWGNGTTGVSGAVSNLNSLVGTTTGDYIGLAIGVELSNGNYLVNSPNWNNGAATVAGAVTWINGATGLTGAVSSSNSLVGGTTNDSVGGYGNITALSNGNYLVRSSNWSVGTGAVTWGSGATGVSGLVSAANSLVGSAQADFVGSGDIVVLTNQNYVVASPSWANGNSTLAGAVTWGSGTTGVKGVVSASNSLVGKGSDRVGVGGVRSLSNGNYVVLSTAWNSGGQVVGVGAATWGNGTTGAFGLVTSSNSLVGSTSFDAVGSGGLVQLPNGNYLLSSPSWANGLATSAGAVTWGDGSLGITGTVSSANSLVGTNTNDGVGGDPITVLTNDNYLVRSLSWSNGTGAVTWGSGASGVKGLVSAANSLIGTAAGDSIGNGGLTELTNGNYVVGSPNWANGLATNAGAVTWGSGSSGVSGVVSAANSLVGTKANDYVGRNNSSNCECNDPGVIALTNGNYLVNSQSWDGGTGALTVGSGATGLVGNVSSVNSALASVSQPMELPDFPGKVLVGSGAANGGAGGVFLLGLATSTASGTSFADSPGADATFGADNLVATLRAGTNVLLQANNDITVNAAINVRAGASAPGTLTLQAGRSVILNAPITTGGADLVVSTDDLGAITANRDAGVGGFINNVGSNGFNTGAGRWLVYASSPANVTKGGLIATMYQYGTVLGNAIDLAGSGFAYASGLSVNANFSGQLASTYGTTPTATLGYSLGGLDVSDTSYTLSKVGGTPIFSYWPIDATTSVGTYALQYASGLSIPGGSTLAVGTAQSYQVKPMQLTVTASLVDSTRKVYDGTTAALLTPFNFSLIGFVNGDQAGITKTSGDYASKNTGSGLLVSTTLAPGDFAPQGNTQLSNYILPTTASGNIGSITALAINLNTPVVTKIYDGTTAYTTTVSDLVSLSSALVGGDTVSAATIKYSDKNAGLGNKTAAIAGWTINDGNGGNNYNVTLAGNTNSTINLADLWVSTSNVTKTYDATIGMIGATGQGAVVVGGTLFAGDSLSGGTFAYIDPNAGQGNKVVTVSGVTAGGGTNFGNYNVIFQNNTTSTINPLTVTWTGNAGTSWSAAGNWSSPFVPDGVNVITPQTLSVTTAIYDLTAPSSVQSINASGSFTLQSGSLTINGDLITPDYSQSGGALSVSGALTVQGKFLQSAGIIDKTGVVSITQDSGDLTFGKITGSTISLQASKGAINQRTSTGPTDPTGLTGLVTLRTTGGASLMNTANRISGFAVADVVSGGVSTRSSGNVALTNGAAMDLSGISLANGNLSIDNTGGISNSVAIKVDGGTVDIKSHSPITVSSAVTASGNITLAALTPDGTSNITLNGAMTSTAGGISIQAYNNFIQNSNLSAALGIDVSTIAGSLTFGPGAYSIGNPVTYSVNGVAYMPPWIASTLSGGATDFVVAFLDQFQAVLDAQQAAPIDDPLGLMQSSQEGIVVEGEICKP